MRFWCREKESAPSSLAYLYSSRRQTGLTTIYKERVRLYRRIPIPRGRSVHLVGDYLSTNLIRIFDTDLLPTKSLHYTALTPYGDQFTLSCICSDGLRHHHKIAAKIRKNLNTPKDSWEICSLCYTVHLKPWIWLNGHGHSCDRDRFSLEVTKKSHISKQK